MRSFTEELGKTPEHTETEGTGETLSPPFLKSPSPLPSLQSSKRRFPSRSELVVIGTSLGGLHALEVLLAGLPKNFPAAVAIVQHRHKDSENLLAAHLQYYSAIPLIEPEDKAVILPGRVYLAPANYHLLVEASQTPGHCAHVALSTEAPVSSARPSIDVLFESAADAYAAKTIGVILTGASDDGARGLVKVKACGGLAVVQDPLSAASPTMPKAAITAVEVDWILPLTEIAPLLVNICCAAKS